MQVIHDEQHLHISGIVIVRVQQVSDEQHQVHIQHQHRQMQQR